MRRSVSSLARALVLTPVIAGVALVLPTAAHAAGAANTAAAGWQAIAVGAAHTCAIDTGGTVYCWGDNQLGQLGTPTAAEVPPPPEGATPPPPSPAPPSPIPLPVGAPVAGLKFTDISAGDNHTCALSTTQDIYCWGSNSSGQLGNGQEPPATPAPGAPPAYSIVPVKVVGSIDSLSLTAVSAGGATTCALATNGHAYCWGDNSAGQLGIGTAGTPNATPAAINALGNIDNRFITDIAVGPTHVCAVVRAAGAFCWGSNAKGQVGAGASGDLAPGGQFLLPHPVDATYLAAEGKQLISISVGATSSCGLAGSGGSDGVAYCWGQFVPTGSVMPIPAPVAATATTTGYDTNGVLRGKQLTTLSAGGGTACALDTTGRAYCWGGGGSGQVGNGQSGGNAAIPPSAVKVSPPYAGAGLASISVGSGHVCALNAKGGTAACWGANGSGQLGLGSLATAVTAVPGAVVAPGSTSPTGSPVPAPTDAGGQPITPVEPASSSGGLFGLPWPIVIGIPLLLALVGLLLKVRSDNGKKASAEARAKTNATVNAQAKGTRNRR